MVDGSKAPGMGKQVFFRKYTEGNYSNRPDSLSSRERDVPGELILGKHTQTLRDGVEKNKQLVAS